MPSIVKTDPWWLDPADPHRVAYVNQALLSPTVPNFWRVLATNPDHLELIWTRLKALMHPEAAGRTPVLDPVTREIIALAVSATNGCAYCVNSHTAALRKLGLSAHALGEVLAVVALFNSTNALADGYQVEPDVLPPLE